MQDLSREKKRLSEALVDLGEEAMLLEELDGSVAGSSSARDDPAQRLAASGLEP